MSQPSSTGKRAFVVVPPDARSFRASSGIVAAPVSRTWGTVSFPAGSLPFRTSCCSQAGWQFVRLARTRPSAGDATRALPPGRLPGESILTRRPALPLAAPYASTHCWRSGMVHRFYRSYSETGPASGARRCLCHFPFLC